MCGAGRSKPRRGVRRAPGSEARPLFGVAAYRVSATQVRRRSITASIAQCSQRRHSPHGSRQSHRPVSEQATVSRLAEQQPSRATGGHAP
jgi:hypothetical protein